MATTYDLQPYISGDTWGGIPSLAIIKNNSPIDLTDAYVEMNVRFQPDAPLVIQFNTNIINPSLSAGYGMLSILEPASSGNIQLPPQIVNIPPADYIYSIKVTLPTEEVETFYTGKWPVIITA